mmetsp:Transcript_100850/g.291637  ORF Transcript_100850/g.291637 Transcript_100850/m.291637 type:complete len:179 (-) Transcript_100850:90-626(-)|eukprot:CAMPEP_0176017634 /NCGR_PEP_ID=MMETSP0120_2-20121206/8463_1 /TAXON_ID=160619 /ORGANISM="Kryptoperidinium foliaceum, Strain CCMP 1326" /LENGTH=178 /DNA_ID=CAMNT_0017350659 /DNA_START=46 /DNA_END=582 /DNA_ORIENTATION=+
MEGLRHSLFAPSTASVLMLFGIVDAMKSMVEARYAAKDDNGKHLLPHPYEPWNAPKDPKNKDVVDKAYRAFKMFENVKEWTFMCLPSMWIVAIYGGDLPYVSDNIMDAITLASGALYSIATKMYISGYLESPGKRMTGFNIRRRVAEFWLFGSAACMAWSGAIRFGLVKGGANGWMSV